MKNLLLASAIVLTTTYPAMADGSHTKPAASLPDAVKSTVDKTKAAAFDIVAAHVHRQGRMATFHMTLNGPAGTKTPVPVGKLAGAPVLSYVWPTSLDPSTVGFEAKTGILALAATSHPDFDDTPLYDENGDGNLANDGAKWHSHWIVLTPTKACGEGKLAVRDIPKGQTPALPATWPGLPLFIDSPGYTPLFNGPEIAIKVAFSSNDVIAGASYDGVTSALKVNANVHAPLLCITDVFDIASGDLSLPGKVK